MTDLIEMSQTDPTALSVLGLYVASDSKHFDFVSLHESLCSQLGLSPISANLVAFMYVDLEEGETIKMNVMSIDSDANGIKKVSDVAFECWPEDHSKLERLASMFCS